MYFMKVSKADITFLNYSISVLPFFFAGGLNRVSLYAILLKDLHTNSSPSQISPLIKFLSTKTYYSSAV